VKVRIRKTPAEREIDGVNLDRFAPGAVRDVSSSLASWLIVEGYAEPEMRRSEPSSDRSEPSGDRKLYGVAETRHVAHDRRRRNI